MLIKSKSVALVLVLAVAMLLSCLAVQGCGKKGGSETTETQGTAETQASTSKATSSKATTPTQPTTPKSQTTPSSSDTDINGAISTSKASAQANNPSIGELTVLAVKIVDGWARVDMQPSNKSTDAASWLLEKVGGSWTVVDFGTSVMPSDHPDAPPGVFQ